MRRSPGGPGRRKRLAREPAALAAWVYGLVRLFILEVCHTHCDAQPKTNKNRRLSGNKGLDIPSSPVQTKISPPS